MAPKIEVRWLWLGLGVFTFIAIKGVSHGLRRIVNLTEVHNAPPQPLIPLPLGKEDAIKTSSLETLAACSNVEIRKAVTKILCDRFSASPSAYRLLKKDLRSHDTETKRKAELAFALLLDYDALPQFAVPLPTPQAVRRNGSQWGRSGETARENENRNPEERDLRRRRREAMVINEGDRPLSQQDVWMRDGEGRMSTEEQMRPRSLFDPLTGQQEDSLMPNPVPLQPR